MSASAAKRPPALALRDLTLGYDGRPAVHHLDVEIPSGALVALVGPNGAGKSTLLKGIVGQVPPSSGRVEIAGHADRRRPRDVAYLPQAAEIDRSFPVSVLDLAATGLWRRLGAWCGFGRGDLARVEAALGAVGLAGFGGRLVGTLSGGQMQRVLFARVLLQDAALILLDEPFAAVDARTTADLVALVEAWHAQGRTVVAALHDLDQVRRHAPTTLLLARELVAYGPTPAVLRPEMLARAGRLQEAWSEDAERCRRGEHAVQCEGDAGIGHAHAHAAQSHAAHVRTARAGLAHAGCGHVGEDAA